MSPTVIPQLLANNGNAAFGAIADPDRFACEPKADGVRGLVVFHEQRGDPEPLYDAQEGSLAEAS